MAVKLNTPFSAVVTGYDDNYRELILSKKAAEPGPLENFLKVHAEGTVVDGVVETVLASGYVLRLDGHVEGFLPTEKVPTPLPRSTELLEDPGGLKAGDAVRGVFTGVVENGRALIGVVGYLAILDRKTEAEIAEYRRAQKDRGGITNDIPAPRERMARELKLVVLLLEDRVGILSPLSYVLERNGHAVLKARDVAAARTALRSAKYLDVALIDLQLEVSGAEDICRDVRGSFPNAKVFLFSGNPEILPHQAQKDCPVDGIIQKPVSTEHLLAYVEGQLRPPLFGRTRAFEESLYSLLRKTSRTASSDSDGMPASSLIDSYFDAVDNALPGAKAAVLSYSKATNTVTCIRARNLPAGYFDPYETKLPFTSICDVMTEGLSRVERVAPDSEQTNHTIANLMRPINSYIYLGYPLHIESKIDTLLGLFVFGPPYESHVPPQKVQEIANIADAFALAVERALIDIAIHRHQKALSVGNLMLGMTHEVRNSVQCIASYASTIENHLDAARKDAGAGNGITKAAGVAREMKEQIGVLIDSLETFLGLVKIDQTGETPLDVMLAEVVESCRGACMRYGVTVVLDVSNHPRMPVVPRILRQAFLNVVLNAVQQTEAVREKNGLVKVSASVVTDDGRRMVEVQVCDNAWGMHARDRDRAFDIFFTGRKFGSGLGLYVTRLMIEGVGGEVEIRETIRFVGTVFRIRVPLPSEGR